MSNDEEGIEERRRQREQARQAEQRRRREDELLQIALTALELGISLEDALEEFDWQRTPSTRTPAEDLQDLRDLLQLAAAIRAKPYPIPQIDWARQLNADLAFQAGMVRPNGRNHSYERKQPMQTEPITKPTRQSADVIWKIANMRSQTISSRPSRTHRTSFIALGGLSVLLLFAVLLTSLGLYLAGPRHANAATLLEVNGQVEALTAEGVWITRADGDRVQSGQRVRTGPASAATLVFFDGTRTSLDPNTDITLAQVDGDWGSVLRVSLTQNAGHTRHSVVPLRGERSAFTVLTPSGVASVHGTHFDVAVNNSGVSRFGVETGRVLVSGEQGGAFLTAGQVTSVQLDGVVEDPTYQFSLRGTLTSVTGTTWIVDGVPFTVTEQTTYTGVDSVGPQIGDEVIVTGRVLVGGEWVADSMADALLSGDPPDGPATSTFTGELESNSGDAWQIAGWTVLVNGSTDIADGLAVGDPVRVTFRLLDDSRWLAVRIESLAEPDDSDPDPEPADPSASPELVFSPTELLAGVCAGGNFSLDASLNNLSEDAATGVELTAQVVEGEQYLTSWEISPASFTEIPTNGSADFAVNLTLNDDWQPAEDGQVRLRIFASAENFSGLFDSILTVTVENNCAGTEEPEETLTVTETPTDTPDITETPTVTNTPTDTPDITETPTVTDTPTNTPEITGTPTDTETPSNTPTPQGTLTSTPTPEDSEPVTACTGAQPHPTGTRLAEKYQVSYEEIMGWFCQGFGFGEIELAYSLSWASYNTENYKTPAEIFAMKAGGMGWGEIQKLFETRGNPKHDVTPPATAGPTTAPPTTAPPTPDDSDEQPAPEPSQDPGRSPGKPEKTPRPPNPRKP